MRRGHCLEQALARLAAPENPRTRLERALARAADPRTRLLRALAAANSTVAEEVEPPRRKVPRRFRGTTERGRLAGARLQERDDEVLRNIEGWRPDLMAAWPQLRVEAYRRAKVMRAKAAPRRVGLTHSVFEAFQQLVHENEDAVLVSIQDRAERDAEEMILRHLEAEMRAAKEVARARGEEAPSEDFRVDRTAAGLGGRRPGKRSAVRWEEERAPASAAA
jgi:hypothetical protein